MDKTAVIQQVNQVLDDLKQEHGFSTEMQLARYLNVSDMTIYRWRRGEFGKIGLALVPVIYAHAQKQVQK
jgi:DNA-binding transcriptional regulator YiaG